MGATSPSLLFPASTSSVEDESVRRNYYQAQPKPSRTVWYALASIFLCIACGSPEAWMELTKDAPGHMPFHDARSFVIFAVLLISAVLIVCAVFRFVVHEWLYTAYHYYRNWAALVLATILWWALAVMWVFLGPSRWFTRILQ